MLTLTRTRTRDLYPHPRPLPATLSHTPRNGVKICPVPKSTKAKNDQVFP